MFYTQGFYSAVFYLSGCYCAQYYIRGFHSATFYIPGSNFILARILKCPVSHTKIVQRPALHILNRVLQCPVYIQGLHSSQSCTQEVYRVLFNKSEAYFTKDTQRLKQSTSTPTRIEVLHTRILQCPALHTRILQCLVLSIGILQCPV